jgi:hypothetical protein
MMRNPLNPGLVALGVFLAFSPACKADLLPWSYRWTASPSDVYSDNSASHVHLTDEPWSATLTGPSTIVATQLETHSTTSPLAPDTFTDRAFTLKLDLKDGTGKQGALDFNGVINGTLSSGNSSVVASFPGELTQEIVVGLTRFTVTIEQSEAVGVPGSQNSASITAQATITAEAIIQELPEPGSLALAAFGLGGLCLAAWRRRRTAS